VSLNDTLLENDHKFWYYININKTTKGRKTMKSKANKLALMCKSHNYKLDSNRNEYRVGNWVIAETRRQQLLGSTVVLTESQTSPAYLGGTIIGFAPTPYHSNKCEVIFKEDPSLVGDTDAVQHRGWGSGRGVCYI
jgi:hypothetical protein